MQIDDHRQPIVSARHRAAAKTRVAALREHTHTGLSAKLDRRGDLLRVRWQRDARRQSAIAAPPVLREGAHIGRWANDAVLTEDRLQRIDQHRKHPRLHRNYFDCYTIHRILHGSSGANAQVAERQQACVFDGAAAKGAKDRCLNSRKREQR